MLKQYIMKDTISEAIQVLSLSKVKIMAGGTDLMIQIREKELEERPERILDISKIAELKIIREEGLKIFIGSMVTYSELIKNELIQENANVLIQMASLVGSPQIRNRGTIGGSIANASPAADSLPVLYSLNANIVVENIKGKRNIPIAEFYSKQEDFLSDNDLIIGVEIDKIHSEEIVKFKKVGRRNAVSIARLNMVTRLSYEGEMIKKAHMVIGAATPSPLDISSDLDFIIGKKPTVGDYKEISQLVIEKMKAVSGVRASAKWKFPAVENLIIRMFKDSSPEGGKDE